MKISIFTGIILLVSIIAGCTNLRPPGDTGGDPVTPPPVVTKSKVTVTVRLAGAGWDVNAYTNVGLVLVPMTNSNTLAAIDEKYDWSNQIVYLNPSASFTYTYSNISLNPYPGGAGKYGLFIFKDTNMNGDPDPYALGLTDPQPDDYTNIVIDGSSAYTVTFQKIRASVIVTLPSTNQGKAYSIYTNSLPVLLTSYPFGLLSILLSGGTISTSNQTAVTNNLTFDNPVSFYIGCHVDISNILARNSGIDWEGSYDNVLTIPIIANVTLLNNNIFSFDVNVIP